MRPIRLELKGFSTFRDDTVVDFADLDLLAFVGPTGAGKSTIIDGIIFALYGSVVRYKSSNLVAPVINQLSNEARVRLDFAVGDSEHTAVRVVRRTAKGATTKEARLESNGEVVAGNARELDDAIEELLGLDFDQFTKTVVLPQGEFARFLTETPEARQSLLRRLLGMEMYRSMGSTARERARTADTKRQALVEQRDDRGTVTTEMVAEASAAHASLAALQDVIADEVAALATAEADEQGQTDASDAADDQVQRLSSLAVPAAAKKFDARFQKLLATRADARANAEAAAEELAAANAEADAHEPVAELERILDLHGERADIDARLAEATTDAAEATTARTEARRGDDAAQEALTNATSERDAARVRAGAAGLRDLLQVGDPCPVCSQEVGSIPDHDVDAELEALAAAVEELTHIADASRHARAAADAAWERADATVVAFTERRDELAEALDGAPNLKATNAALRAARKVDATLQKVRTRAESALGALQDAEAGLAELDDEAAELRRELTGHRDELAELEPPRPDERSIGDDWQALAAWGKAQLGEARARKKEAVAAARAATKRADGHRKVIADLCRPHDGGATPDDPVAWLASEIGRAQAERSALEAEQAAQARTAERIDSLATEHAVAAELGRLLNARGFEQWLMADVMHTLAERATERLFDLSGGAYSLLTDGTDFSIRDHRNADEVRGARTLSGGETFLASLSLALALADNIADLAPEGAARIESMFLDEGFGTLDPETLDVVAGAIEDLGAEGRMIGVVTHIRELADRIPVRFEVGRTPTGSTVTRTTIS
jgi:exonuclease SbcC